MFVVHEFSHWCLQTSSKRFGASLGALSSGRVGISSLAVGLLISCCTIAVRYSCVRKQFGPSPGVEIPVIEYQTQVNLPYSIRKKTLTLLSSLELAIATFCRLDLCLPTSRFDRLRQPGWILRSVHVTRWERSRFTVLHGQRTACSFMYLQSDLYMEHAESVSRVSWGLRWSRLFIP